MGQRTLKKIDFFIIGYAAVLCCGALIIFGQSTFFSVLAGSIIAFLNWVASRWLGIRLVMTGSKQKMAILLGVKTVVTLGVIGVVLSTTPVEPIAFLIGLSTMVLGVLSNSAIDVIAEGDKALREER